jgi:hypothetical protein
MMMAPQRTKLTTALAAFCALVAAAPPVGRAGAAMLDEAGERAVLEADQLFGDMAERMIVLAVTTAVTASEASAEEGSREDTSGKAPMSPDGETEEGEE